MPRVPGRLLPSGSSRGARSGPWPVSPPPTWGALAATGHHARWPTKRANGAWSSPWLSAMGGVVDNHVALKPPRSRDWLPRAPDEAADETMADGTSLSWQAPAWRDAGERGVSTDEMPGIQALARQHPTMPMGPGRVERRAFEDIRHGTLSLIANGDGAQGQVGAPSLGPTRTAEDCVAHMARTVASAPEATRRHCVTDTCAYASVRTLGPLGGQARGDHG